MDRCEAWPTSSTSSPWRWRTLFYATLVVSAVAGCGASAASNGPNTAPVASGAASTTPFQTASSDGPTASSSGASSRVPSPTAAIAPEFLTYKASGTTRDGVNATSTVELEPKIRLAKDVADDPVYGPVLETCEFDSERDAVVLGRVASTANNGGFKTTVGTYVQFLTPDGLASFGSLPSDLISRLGEGAPAGGGIGSWSYAVGYGTPACTTHSTSRDPRTPNFAAAASIAAGKDVTNWGPVEVALILPGYLSPAHPSGNPAYSEMLSHLELCLTNGGGADTGSVVVNACAGGVGSGGGSNNPPEGVGGSDAPYEQRTTWFPFMASIA